MKLKFHAIKGCQSRVSYVYRSTTKFVEAANMERPPKSGGPRQVYWNKALGNQFRSINFQFSPIHFRFRELGDLFVAPKFQLN